MNMHEFLQTRITPWHWLPNVRHETTRYSVTSSRIYGAAWSFQL